MLTPVKNNLDEAWPLGIFYERRREPEFPELNPAFRTLTFTRLTIRLNISFGKIVVWQTNSQEVFNGWAPTILKYTRFNQSLRARLKADVNIN